MRKAFKPWIAHALATVVLAAAAAGVLAIEQGPRATVQGIQIYYGIMPAEVVGKHPPPHEESSMHGGAPARTNAYHLVVALFDTGGERITAADVRANVAELGLAGAYRKLEPMRIDDTLTYGGYYTMAGDGPYRITIEVRLPGARKPLEAVFEYRRR